jgi:exonuclease III
MAISIIQHNINGLIAHIREFKHFLLQKQVDIVCLQETFLKPTKTANFPGYTTIRKDRIDRKGGLLILVKQGIKFVEIKTNDSVECQVIKIISDENDIILANIYISPNPDVDEKD